MAVVVNGSQLKLSNGQTVQAQQGGWYDGQQFWGGTLSNPGQINSLSNQQGAGAAVSQQVVAQTDPNNVPYVNEQRQNLGLPASPDANNPTPAPQEQVVAPQTASGGIFGNAGGGGIGTAGGGSLGLGAGGLGVGATLNLPQLYQSLYQSSGVADLEKQLTDKEAGYNDAVSKINDNPFLSEANRTGRIQKLTTDYNNNIANDHNALSMKKADIQMQLDLQTKQFDINSQAAQQALSTFNSLLQSGALDNASGADISNITMATGLSSQAIQSAIDANKKKNVQTSVMQFDDGTNQGFAVVDTQTGEIISKHVISGSKPPAQTAQTSQYTTDSNTIKLENQQAPNVLLQGAKLGKTLPDMVAYGAAHGVSAQDVYNIYAGVNYYHATAAQVKADKKKYGLK